MMPTRSADVLIDALAARLAAHDWTEQTLTAAFSGGRDSVALLAALHELRPRFGYALQALHVNHHLSPNADGWQRFCEDFCARRAIPLRVHHLRLERAGGVSLEALARAGRYEALAAVEGAYVALAHHAGDQAETFLLQALRGAGPLGLAAMAPARTWRGKTLLRPFLDLPRVVLESWLRERGLSWVDDESNADERYRRNAVRHRVLPELERLHAGGVGALARSAELCGETVELLGDMARLDGEPDAPTLPVSRLASLSRARAKNLLRFWLLRHDVPLPASAALEAFVSQILTAAGDTLPELRIGPFAVRRFDGRLWLDRPWTPAPVELSWAGEPRLRVDAWRGELELRPAATGLDPERLRLARLRLDGRRGGERLRVSAGRPSQSLKHHFQARGLPPWLRERWPLLYAEERLIAVPGLGTASDWQSAPGLEIIWHPD